MNTKQIKRSVLVSVLGLSLAVLVTDWKSTTAIASNHDLQQEKPADQAKPAVPDKPAEEVYKNIQVLKGVPAPRLMGAMNFFARSLGVKCNHCHVPGAFEKDDKPEKLTARKMYEMVRVSQRELGNNRVSCFMCHRGQVHPEQPPDSWKAEAEEMMKKGEADKRPAEQVYKNVQALKGVPAGRWMLIMTMFSKSLGVECSHCHVEGAFEKDDKPAKQTARKMLAMVSAISKEVYKGPTPINCYTCHKGKTEPVSFPPPPQKPQ
jgi:Photosynthetic reaction centre cytochrome C subunit